MYVPYTFVLQYVQVDIALIKWSAPLEIDKIYEQQERNSKEMNTVHNILKTTTTTTTVTMYKKIWQWFDVNYKMSNKTDSTVGIQQEHVVQ